MGKNEKEIKLLKKLVKAQARIIYTYKLGGTQLPEWVFKAMDAAKEYYRVDMIEDIK